MLITHPQPEKLTIEQFYARFTPVRLERAGTRIEFRVVPTVEESLCDFPVPVDHDNSEPVDSATLFAHTWSYIDNNDGQAGYYISGLYRVNRIGIFHTLEPHAGRGMQIIDFSN